jgi:outer membrane protein assembly factor BamD
MHNILHKTFLALGCAVLHCLVIACGAARSNIIPRTVDDVFTLGVEEFRLGNYAQAQKLLDIIKLQYPASKYADDAQYYLAEINFAKGEYILAAYNYNQVRRTFPNSEYAKISMYKAALSNQKLSPKSDRDQDYTKQAIRAFAEFQAAYPKDSLAKEAGLRIRELRNKLAEHDFRTAELYVKLYAPRSALTYYDLVLNNYSDCDYTEPAFAGKIKMLARLKRIPEAKESLRLYRAKFPNGASLNDLNQLAAILELPASSSALPTSVQQRASQ